MKKGTATFKAVCIALIALFSNSIILPSARAAYLNLPSPSQMVPLSHTYSFPVLKGLRLDFDNPLNIEFIIDAGSKDEVTEQDASRLIKYFLAGLTIPEDNLWVNLSPYEEDRIIPEKLAETDLGKDLLSQDYILKQLLSSVTHPESKTGKDYWKKTYEEIDRVTRKIDPVRTRVRQGRTASNGVNTFNKIWIMPESANVYENNNVALVTQASLKAMLQEDYMLQASSSMPQAPGFPTNNQLQTTNYINKTASEVMKQVILPKINRDVNNGKNFATLRQIYHSIILAEWFKQKFKDSFYKNYLNKEKIKGIDLEDKEIKEKVYSLYTEAFQKGLYDYIKTEKEPQTDKTIKRRYFSGGALISPTQAGVLQTSSSLINLQNLGDIKEWHARASVLPLQGEESINLSSSITSSVKTTPERYPGFEEIDLWEDLTDPHTTKSLDEAGDIKVIRDKNDNGIFFQICSKDGLYRLFAARDGFIFTNHPDANLDDSFTLSQKPKYWAFTTLVNKKDKKKIKVVMVPEIWESIKENFPKSITSRSGYTVTMETSDFLDVNGELLGDLGNAVEGFEGGEKVTHVSENILAGKEKIIISEWLYDEENPQDNPLYEISRQGATVCVKGIEGANTRYGYSLQNTSLNNWTCSNPYTDVAIFFINYSPGNHTFTLKRNASFLNNFRFKVRKTLSSPINFESTRVIIDKENAQLLDTLEIGDISKRNSSILIPAPVVNGDARIAVYETFPGGDTKEKLCFTFMYNDGDLLFTGPGVRPITDTYWKYEPKGTSYKNIDIFYINNLRGLDQLTLNIPGSGLTHTPATTYEIRLEPMSSSPIKALFIGTNLHQDITKALSGHTLETVSNGKQALQKLNNKDYDIIIIDKDNPLISWQDAIGGLRKLYPKLTIILTGSHIEHDDTLFCSRLNAATHITGSIFGNGLAKKIQEIALQSTEEYSKNTSLAEARLSSSIEASEKPSPSEEIREKINILNEFAGQLNAGQKKRQLSFVPRETDSFRKDRYYWAVDTTLGKELYTAYLPPDTDFPELFKDIETIYPFLQNNDSSDNTLIQLWQDTKKQLTAEKKPTLSSSIEEKMTAKTTQTSSPLTVLCIDPFHNRDGLEKKLESSGHTVFTAENEKSGLEIFKKHEPDLVVIYENAYDWQKLIKTLKETNPTLPIVLIGLSFDSMSIDIASDVYQYIYAYPTISDRQIRDILTTTAELAKKRQTTTAFSSSSIEKQQPKILIAYSDENVLEGLPRNPSLSGYSVKTVQSWEDAVGIFQKDNSYDLIIAEEDLLLQKGTLDGNLNKIKNTKDIPIVLITTTDSTNSEYSQRLKKTSNVKSVQWTQFSTALEQGLVEKLTTNSQTSSSSAKKPEKMLVAASAERLIITSMQIEKILKAQEYDADTTTNINEAMRQFKEGDIQGLIIIDDSEEKLKEELNIRYYYKEAKRSSLKTIEMDDDPNFYSTLEEAVLDSIDSLSSSSIEKHPGYKPLDWEDVSNPEGKDFLNKHVNIKKNKTLKGDEIILEISNFTDLKHSKHILSIEQFGGGLICYKSYYPEEKKLTVNLPDKTGSRMLEVYINEETNKMIVEMIPELWEVLKKRGFPDRIDFLNKGFQEKSVLEVKISSPITTLKKTYSPGQKETIALLNNFTTGVRLNPPGKNTAHELEIISDGIMSPSNLQDGNYDWKTVTHIDKKNGYTTDIHHIYIYPETDFSKLAEAFKKKIPDLLKKDSSLSPEKQQQWREFELKTRGFTRISWEDVKKVPGNTIRIGEDKAISINNYEDATFFDTWHKGNKECLKISADADEKKFTAANYDGSKHVSLNLSQQLYPYIFYVYKNENTQEVIVDIVEPEAWEKIKNIFQPQITADNGWKVSLETFSSSPVILDDPDEIYEELLQLSPDDRVTMIVEMKDGRGEIIEIELNNQVVIDNDFSTAEITVSDEKYDSNPYTCRYDQVRELKVLSSPIKVLLVDDSPVDIITTRRLLTEKGYDVETARDGEEALEKFKQGSYDIIISDVIMPEMTGTELLSAIKKEHPEFPFILATSYMDEDTERNILSDYKKLEIILKINIRSQLEGKITSVMSQSPSNSSINGGISLKGKGIKTEYGSRPSYFKNLEIGEFDGVSFKIHAIKKGNLVKELLASAR